ncbi:hypothetical protein [Imhoffiella purpurea]|uniref:Uncharacterized protein n=1 Tax=Imhoffiella purpurea TaxID=1249627 RepID=W9VE17_9GAMM|nr:hypothetical protein [Imhoffiella purpurea]EXJ15241.1 hypothetical protein D779_1539 [Imhoffiella purpurea]
MEDLHAECAALRERLREAESRFSGASNASPTSSPPPPASAGAEAPSDRNCSAAFDQAIGDATQAALRLMESAIAERIRAVSMEKDLQREIRHRRCAEEALREAEHRCNRILDTIGDVRWISTEDWETILDIDPKDRSPRRPTEMSD